LDLDLFLHVDPADGMNRKNWNWIHPVF